MRGKDGVDLAILTALEVERAAICSVFGLGDGQREKRGGRVYWRGQLRLEDGEFYEIVVGQPREMGQVEAALLASDAIRDWSPSAALLVGIAASAKKDVKLGDVVVGHSVLYHEHGKVTPEGTQAHPEMIVADALLLNQVVGLPSWAESVPAVPPDGTIRHPRVHHGVIASGEKVIADAATRGAIAATHRKIMAIEMESYGFSRAVWQSLGQVRHLNIRGICDEGDEKKDDRWHLYAATSAAAFARHFLRDRPIEPKGSVRPQ